MSIENAKIWLSSHDETIPAFDGFYGRATSLLNLGIAPLSEIANVIMLDPGMTILLLQRVNTKLKNSKRAGIETLHTAMGHLGKPAIATLLSRHKKLTDVCTLEANQNHYRQLLCQGYHALAQLDNFARMQGMSSLDDMRTAMLLYNLGELQVCLFDPDKYQQFRNQLNRGIKDSNPAIDTFGFDFIQLGKLLAQKWTLPELIVESFEDTKNTTGRKPRLIQLAAEIAKQGEVGWYHPSMKRAQKQCADYLNISPKEACQITQNTAIQAARSSPIENVMHSAARLILLTDAKPVAKPEPELSIPVAKKPVKKATVPEQLKSLLKNPEVTQLNILSTLLNGLHNDLNFSCVALMLLSPDKSVLATRAGKGLENNQAFSQLQIEIAHSGIIKSLVSKPQALCIDASNYNKYDRLLPGKLKAACLCNNFVVMSVFIGDKPIGLVYCDRQQTEVAIDDGSYQSFKSSVMMASKVLSYLAKKKTLANA